MQSESKEKLRFKKNLYRISLFSFVVVVIWIGFEIYFSYTKKPQEEISTINLEPLIPNLHIQLAQELQNRNSIADTDLEAFKATLSREFIDDSQPKSTGNSKKTNPSLLQSTASATFNPVP